MAESIAKSVSTEGVAEFGLKLGSTLQVYIATCFRAYGYADRKTRTNLIELVQEINSAASTLKQLQSFLDDTTPDDDAQFVGPVFKAGGKKQVEEWVSQTGKLFAAIANLVRRAGSRKFPSGIPGSEDGENLKLSTLNGNVDWGFLQNRIDSYKQNLKWLNVNLHFSLQLASLAQFQMRYVLYL